MRIAILLLLGACTSSSTHPAEGYCTRVTRLLCASNERCCDLEERTYATEAECFEENLFLCANAFEDPARDDYLAYDSVAAGALEAEIRARTEDCGALDLGLRSGEGGVHDVFGSTRGAGDACGGDIPWSACSEFCLREVDSGLGGLGDLVGEGTCGPPLSEGELCWAGSAVLPCEAGLTCIVGETEGRCAPSPVEGEACAGFLDCAEGLACFSAVCVPLCPNGDLCEGSTCASRFRDEDNRCADPPPARSHCDVWRPIG
ncbi:MAG: hypothetical protein AAGE52_29055 [Myxococcota bacterium]